ncbi:MAG TPA: helix-turn-helix domain-containing protein [Polyangia bacterium]|jgi:DNA-binding HxlR family transcriptional regulator|nr:helix-turn-helix domain-containing protein [Polyangia bacterium]
MRKSSSTNLQNERWLLDKCPFNLTLSALGNRWRAAVLWKILRGERRFGDLMRAIPRITEKMLAQELERLQSLGLVEKQVCSERPLRVEYAVTERGGSLEPLLASMYAWGEMQQALAREQQDLPEVQLLERQSS